jgi:hypothetical protein
MVLIAAALLLAGAGIRAQQKPGSYGDLKEVTLQGKLISVGDEMARKYGARLPPGTEKQWGLASPEGQIYTFLPTETARKLIATGEGGEAVEVEARHFPRSMLLEVLSFKPLPQTAIERRFFCGICTVYADDWGPCVCCGKEMEPIKAP